MQHRFKLGALAWGIAAAIAFPAGAAASNSAGMLTVPTGNNSAVCNQLATGNTNAANQCRQENTATNTQTATATGGAGGSATGGNAGPVQVVGNGSQGGSYGGDAYANGGDAEAHNSLENEQSNQISGRDSSSGSYVGGGNNNSDVCKQLATGNTQGNDQCHQSNTAANTQTATSTGGAGGTATGGNAGPVQVVGNGSQGGSYGGDADANGGDAESRNSLENEQSNQISGRDSSGSGYGWDGYNNSAICNLLATGNTFGDQCHQSNTATNTQTATATGGAGGTATGGNAGPSQVVDDDYEGGSYGGDAYANGGDAESRNSLENEQSNQLSGRDSQASDPQTKPKAKKAKKSKKRAKSRMSRFVR
jgi:hypothetical protein